MWEREEDLENVKELVDKFKGRLIAEIRKQKEIDQRQKVKLNLRAEEYKRIELLGNYMAKLLFGWDDKKFEDKYLKKLERNWNRQKNDKKKYEKKYEREYVKKYEREYVKKLEKSLEWNEVDEQTSRIIWRNEKEVSLEAEP